MYEVIVVVVAGTKTAANPGQKESAGQADGRIVPAVVTRKALPGRMSVQAESSEAVVIVVVPIAVAVIVVTPPEFEGVTMYATPADRPVVIAVMAILPMPAGQLQTSPFAIAPTEIAPPHRPPAKVALLAAAAPWKPNSSRHAATTTTFFDIFLED